MKNMKFTYTPVDHKGNALETKVIETDKFDNVEEVFEARLKRKISFFVPKTSRKSSIAKRLNLTRYVDIEQLRRSPQWHRSVLNYTDDVNDIHRLVLSMHGRNGHNR